MATDHHNNEIRFDDEHYMTLAGIIGVWWKIFREINEPSDLNALPSRELEDLCCAMSVLVNNLSAALERRGMREEDQQREALRQICTATGDPTRADVADICARIRPRQ